MSEYEAIECHLCGYYFMTHLGACPNCFPEQNSGSTDGIVTTIAYPIKAQKQAKEPSKLEQDFLIAWQSTGWPMPEQEYRFHHKRKWRFDFAGTQLV